MIENAIENRVVEDAEKAGWLVRKLSWVGRRGGMDRFFAKDGRTVLIEFKKPGGKTSANQAKEVARFLGAGVEVHVLDNPLTAYRVLGIDYARV